MTYFKTTANGFIQSLSTGLGQEEISREEYDRLMTILNTRPTLPQGKGCRLKEDLTWELYDLPPQAEPEPFRRQTTALSPEGRL